MEIKNNNLIYLIILFNIILRIASAFYFGDTEVHMEWGRLVHNLSLTGILGINVIIDNFSALTEYAKPGDTVIPSVFMPPLYAYYVYLLKILSFDFFELVNLVIFSQIILSSISIYVFFKILQNFCTKNLSLLLTILFSTFPLYVYSSIQTSSITLQIFLIIFYLYYILKFLDEKNFKNIIFFSIFGGLLILTRGEFFIFYLFTLLYFFIFLKFRLKPLIISLVISILLISPYLKRNFDNFQVLVLTKSFGYNLLKGNNPELKVEGSYTYILKNFNQKDLKIKTDNHYEINLDNFYREKAIEIIQDNPLLYLGLYFKKVISFLFIDLNSSYPNYYNLFHIVPKIIISIFSFFGAMLCFTRKGLFQFLSFYYVLNILLFSVFFILPRYSLILLPVQLLLSIQAIDYLRRKLFN